MILQHLHGGHVSSRDVIRSDAVASLQGIHPFDVELIDRLPLILDEPVERDFYVRELPQYIGDHHITLSDEGSDRIADRILPPPDLTSLHLYLLQQDTSFSDGEVVCLADVRYEPIHSLDLHACSAEDQLG